VAFVATVQLVAAGWDHPIRDVFEMAALVWDVDSATADNAELVDLFEAGWHVADETDWELWFWDFVGLMGWAWRLGLLYHTIRGQVSYQLRVLLSITKLSLRLLMKRFIAL
jgi:hypothetical protein